MGDILAIDIMKDTNWVYTWYKDGTVSCGMSRELDMYWPYAGSFEILFEDVVDSDLQVPPLLSQSSLTGGSNPSVSVETVLEGGSSRAKRMGRNWIGDVDDTETRLRADFDDGTDVANTIGGGDDGLGQGANEAFYAAGDSGAPVFIGGQIAGVHKGRGGVGVDGQSQTSDFGEINRYVRVSTYQDFIGDGDDTYTISAKTVSRAGFHVDYAHVESLRLDANPGANTINVQSLGATTDLAISAGGGPDSIHLAPTSRRLGDIQGAVIVNGASGEDDLVLHDENNASPAASLTINHNVVTRPGFELLYGNVTRLVAQLGGPADVVDIQSTALGMHVMVQTGGGADAITANVPSAAQLTLDGSAGEDEVTLTGTPASNALYASSSSGSRYRFRSRRRGRAGDCGPTRDRGCLWDCLSLGHVLLCSLRRSLVWRAPSCPLGTDVGIFRSLLLVCQPRHARHLRQGYAHRLRRVSGVRSLRRFHRRVKPADS